MDVWLRLGQQAYNGDKISNNHNQKLNLKKIDDFSITSVLD